MSDIVTLTMNPSVDVSVETEHVVPEHKVRCGRPRLDPGGGGLNVARVIRELGGHALAVYPAGGPTGELLSQLVREVGVDFEPIEIAGRTRESFTVTETATSAQFRFVLPGPELDVRTATDVCSDWLRSTRRRAMSSRVVAYRPECR
jgi:6-phosphofructokinase 2